MLHLGEGEARKRMRRRSQRSSKGAGLATRAGRMLKVSDLAAQVSPALASE